MWPFKKKIKEEQEPVEKEPAEGKILSFTEKNFTDKPKVTLSGNPPADGYENLGAPQPVDPDTGMHKDYWVLSDEELAKGFIRPYRYRYVHAVELGGCGTVTVMGEKLAATYARDPKFYGATFCCGCGAHYPVSEFRWTSDDQVVGS